MGLLKNLPFEASRDLVFARGSQLGSIVEGVICYGTNLSNSCEFSIDHYIYIPTDPTAYSILSHNKKKTITTCIALFPHRLARDHQFIDTDLTFLLAQHVWRAACASFAPLKSFQNMYRICFAQLLARTRELCILYIQHLCARAFCDLCKTLHQLRSPSITLVELHARRGHHTTIQKACGDNLLIICARACCVQTCEHRAMLLYMLPSANDIACFLERRRRSIYMCCHQQTRAPPPRQRANCGGANQPRADHF